MGKKTGKVNICQMAQNDNAPWSEQGEMKYTYQKRPTEHVLPEEFLLINVIFL
jgi:hypothetical protein